MIRNSLQSLFVSLQEELLKSPLFDHTLSTSEGKVEDDGNGSYKYKIPFRDEKGLLILTYENAEEGFEENTFIFQFKKPVATDNAGSYLAAGKDLEAWLEDEGTLCQWGYEQEDAKAWIKVTTSLTKSWKGPSSNKLEELSECVKEGWALMEKWEALAGNRPN